MKKVLAGLGVSAMMLGSTVLPVFAAGTVPTQVSSCGATHGAFADVNGNFGFLGEAGGTPGYHNGAVGQQSGATGYNNSNVDCSSQS